MSIVFSRYIGVARRIFLPFLLFLLLLHSVGCKQDTKSGAGQLLALMHEAYEHADYSGVRILADSLHRHYSTDTVARKEALSLSRQAEYKECERNRAFADSALLVLSGRIDSISRPFSKTSSEEGRSPEFYLSGFGETSGQERTRLRCSTDTLGNLIVLSVYAGAKAINHTAIRVTDVQTKSTLQTRDIPYDAALNYRFADLGLHYEIVTYPAEETVKIGELFVQADSEGYALRIDLMAEGKAMHTFQISGAGVKALSETARLGQMYSTRTALIREREKAEKRIRYLSDKLAPSSR
ncbi:hypothetical protein HQ42_01800 [Porphyromonas gulae]|uniref:hypothetical protein n=1 Tax=Porphyromonas gulae TaxID=111105 RepID=UPI00052B7641|nr:hypothetical protein [Porphyromonas gulae]KGO03272.1 hypothetical protein HQ42_01800 [Porphyromonas gulae]